ncbi:hypothetical protein VC95412_002855A, partial [Vibrio cholerae O1 str. 95412]
MLFSEWTTHISLVGRLARLKFI